LTLIVVRHVFSLPAIDRCFAHRGVIPEISEKSACRIVIAKRRSAMPPQK
jgi:hypothetical protein